MIYLEKSEINWINQNCIVVFSRKTVSWNGDELDSFLKNITGQFQSLTMKINFELSSHLC